MPIGMQVIICCNSKYLQIRVETQNVVATLEALKDIHTEQSEYLHIVHLQSHYFIYKKYDVQQCVSTEDCPRSMLSLAFTLCPKRE